MKHSDFYSMVQAIKKQSYNELFRAVEAHGGCYEWPDEEEAPIIAVNPDCVAPSPIDIIVTKAYIREGRLRLCGEEKEYGTEYDFDPHEAFTGHLAYVIDCIPETDKVKDTGI
jgi:hypothetical protein